MDWDTLSPILISVGVIAATIAAIANIVVARMNSNYLRSLENDRRKSELVQYRYTKLYSILEDIEREHGFQNYIGDTDKSFWNAVSKRERYVELYRLARPLIENKLRVPLDEVAKHEELQFAPIVEGTHKKDLEFINEHMKGWSDSINCLVKMLSQTIQEQITYLMS